MPVLQTVTALFAFTSFIVSIMAAMGRCPSWLPSLVLAMTVLLIVFPK
jgi:hypothetical protein